MEAPGDLWSSLYFVPVIGVFALAGVVYYLSFRSSSKDDDNQSLRIYLNVLSGDDEKNRKAAKKLRKFGSLANTKRLTASGSEGTDSKQVDSDGENQQPLQSRHSQKGAVVHVTNAPVLESLSASRKPTQLSATSKKTDLPVAGTASSSLSVCPVATPSSQVATPLSQVPEVETDAVCLSSLDDNETKAELSASAGWHKATSKKEKRLSSGENTKAAGDDRHSTTSEDSRPSSFRNNSNSSRNSSPHRRFSGTPSFFEGRQYNKKPTTKNQLERPKNLKLENSSTVFYAKNKNFCEKTNFFSEKNKNFCEKKDVFCEKKPVFSEKKDVFCPKILLSKSSEVSESVVLLPGMSFRTVPRSSSLNDHPRNCTLPPGQSDMCIQTEESEDYPSPLEGLKEVDEGKPRFVIFQDFQMQVDFDLSENNSECESEMRFEMHFEDGDKILFSSANCFNSTLFSSANSLSSGDGSSRVTPVLEEDFPKEFTMTAEKSQGVHQRNPPYTTRIYSRQSVHNNHRGGGSNSGGNGGGSGDSAYYVGHSTCRVEKGSSDWMDHPSRRGRTPLNGRWRN